MAPPETLGPELRSLVALTRRLPPFPRATALVNRAVKPWFLRKPRGQVTADVLGFTMRLDPAEAIDGAYLFYPQLHDRHERAFLEANLGPGDTFVDIGAYIGFYSLIAARAVSPDGWVIAIEPQSASFARLTWNLAANSIDCATAIRLGVSDVSGVRALSVNEKRNRGGSSFSVAGERVEEVDCRPLLDIIRAHDLRRVAGMKLDVEGDEQRVLERFLSDAPVELLPRFLVVEGRGRDDPAADVRLLALLRHHGYRLRSSHFGNALNYIVVR